MTKHRHPAKPVENEAEIKQRLLAGLASGEPKPMTEADWEFFRKRALANSKIRESMAYRLD